MKCFSSECFGVKSRVVKIEVCQLKVQLNPFITLHGICKPNNQRIRNGIPASPIDRGESRILWLAKVSHIYVRNSYAKDWLNVRMHTKLICLDGDFQEYDTNRHI